MLIKHVWWVVYTIWEVRNSMAIFIEHNGEYLEVLLISSAVML